MKNNFATKELRKGSGSSQVNVFANKKFEILMQNEMTQNQNLSIYFFANTKKK
jgi:hypothetical protein